MRVSSMNSNGKNTSRYCGYRTPFHDEVCSERLYFQSLKNRHSKLLPIGRQVVVFEREKLDLLALDSNSVPWVFEFKRDIADYEAVAQVLAYGSYVAQWSRAELERIYTGDDKRRSLERDFARHFGVSLNKTLDNAVNLVLAAFDFSLPCLRTLDFLRTGANLTIGRLKIDCIWDGQVPPQPEYRWLTLPEATHELKLHSEVISPRPHFILLAGEEDLELTWKDCKVNSLVPVSQKYALDQPIPINAGMFVALRQEEDELFGLTAYGLICGEAFDLWTRPREFEIEAVTLELGMERRQPLWVLPVKWVQKLDLDMVNQAALRAPEYATIQEIHDNEEILNYKAALGVGEEIPF